MHRVKPNVSVHIGNPSPQEAKAANCEFKTDPVYTYNSTSKFSERESGYLTFYEGNGNSY